MGFQKTDLKEFKRKLTAGEYKDATGARRGVGKASEMSEADKKAATKAIDAHDGPWAGGGKAKKIAKKPAAKKASAPKKVAAKKTAKKAAGKPAAAAAEAASVPAAKKPAAKKGARAKRVAKSGRKAKGADKEARPATEQELTPKATRPVLPEVPVFSHEDIARNPMAVKNYAIDALGAFGQAYGVYVSMSKEHPEFPLQAMINELGEGMQKAHAMLGAGVGVVHEAAMRVGVIPGSTMMPSTPAPAPQGSELPPEARAVAEKAAAAAKKVHGVDQTTPAARPS